MINEIIYWELYALVVSFFNGVLLEIGRAHV